MLWTAKRALIDQYVARSKVSAARGQKRLAKRFSKYAFDQMREVSDILDRIVTLHSIPELRPVDPVPVGRTPAEQLRFSREAERLLTPKMQQTRLICEQEGDEETLMLVVAGIRQGEERIAWLKSKS
jgi:bacterioferritin (cytochrome b1)